MAKKIKNVITHKWSFKTPMILRAQFLMSWATFEPSIWASSHHQYYYFEILGFYCEQKHCTDDKRFLRYTYYVKKSFTDWSQGGEQITRFAAAVCWVAVLMPLIKAEATLLRMGFSSSSGTFKPAAMYLKMSAWCSNSAHWPDVKGETTWAGASVALCTTPPPRLVRELLRRHDDCVDWSVSFMALYFADLHLCSDAPAQVMMRVLVLLQKYIIGEPGKLV